MLPLEEATLGEAKEQFTTAVREGISILMSQCGYSRDRATSALLRELAKGEVRPDDDQLFETMKKLGLGMDEALKAMTVSNALKRALEAGANPVEAIRQLASKISIGNLMYESSSDEDPTSDTEMPTRREVRIEPVSSQQLAGPTRIKSSSINSGSTRKHKSTPKTLKTKSKTMGKSVIAGRKRSIDEMPVIDCNNYQGRDRANSVSDLVDAKLSKNSTSDESVTNPVAVRSKRGVHRVEDAEPSAHASKRIRGNDS